MDLPGYLCWFIALARFDYLREHFFFHPIQLILGWDFCPQVYIRVCCKSIDCILARVISHLFPNDSTINPATSVMSALQHSVGCATIGKLSFDIPTIPSVRFRDYPTIRSRAAASIRMCESISRDLSRTRSAIDSRGIIVTIFRYDCDVNYRTSPRFIRYFSIRNPFWHSQSYRQN